MSISKRIALAVAALAMAAAPAAAQDFPTKPVTIVVPFSAGGPSDLIVRALQDTLSKKLGQPVLVDNKPGAGGLVGGEFVANAPADGYTILNAGAGIAVAPAMTKDLRFDAAALKGVSLNWVEPFVLVVRKDLGIDAIGALVERAKAEPGKLVLGYSGLSNELATLLFERATGTDLLLVQYKSTGDGMSAMLAGEVDGWISNIGAARPHIQSGAFTALGVTAEGEYTGLPGVPAFGAPYKDAWVQAWQGFVVPAGTPDSAIAVLHKALREAADDPVVKENFAKIGQPYVTSASPAEFDAFYQAEIQRYIDLAAAIGLEKR